MVCLLSTQKNWDAVAGLLQMGYIAHLAADRVYKTYGKRLLVTMIIDTIIVDKQVGIGFNASISEKIQMSSVCLSVCLCVRNSYLKFLLKCRKCCLVSVCV